MTTNHNKLNYCERFCRSGLLDHVTVLFSILGYLRIDIRWHIDLTPKMYYKTAGDQIAGLHFKVKLLHHIMVYFGDENHDS